MPASFGGEKKKVPNAKSTSKIFACQTGVKSPKIYGFFFLARVYNPVGNTAAQDSSSKLVSLNFLARQLLTELPGVQKFPPRRCPAPPS